MAYISKQDVQEIRRRMKLLFPKDWKFSITRSHSDSINITLMEGPIQIEGDYLQLNDMRPDIHDDTIKEYVELLNEIVEDVKANYDSNAGDMGADYPAWNYHKNYAIGKWDKPYVYNGVAIEV